MPTKAEPGPQHAGARTKSLTAWVVAIIVAVSVGVLVGLRVSGSPPRGLEAASPHTFAPVESQQFDDARVADVSFLTGPRVDIRTSMPGVVTFLASEGTTIDSGQLLMQVNGQPILGLATQTPLYRDIGFGTSGPDVSALNNELVRLGFLSESSGDVFDSGSSAGWRRLQSHAGVTEAADEVSLAQTVWLPSDPVSLNVWRPAVGASVPSDGVIGTIPGKLISVTIHDVQGPAMRPGARVLTLMGASASIGEFGELPVTVSAPEFLRAIETSPQYRDYLAAPDQETVGSLRLESPVPALRVPIGAVFDMDGSRGCIQSGGVSFRVEILAATLGAAVVVPDEPAELTEVDLGDATTGGC